MQTTTHAKPFIFEFFWLSHPNFANNIKTWWRATSDTEGALMYRFQQTLKKIKVHLKSWNKLVFKNIHQAKKGLERKNGNHPTRNDPKWKNKQSSGGGKYHSKAIGREVHSIGNPMETKIKITMVKRR